MFAGVYLPPEGSSFYSDESNGVVMLEADILQAFELCNDSPSLVIMGDLNARTGIDPDFIIDDESPHESYDLWYPVDNFCLNRESCDKNNVNNFGVSLLQLCQMLNVHILNGRSTGDLKGDFTCITPRGCSVVDYVLLSSELFEIVNNFEVVHDQFSESVHLPIAFSCCLTTDTQGEVLPQVKVKDRVRFQWDSSKKQNFREALSLDDRYNQINLFVNSKDVESSVNMLINIIQSAAVNMKKQYSNKKFINNSQPVWWDKELQSLKMRKSRLLNKFRRTHSIKILSMYFTVKRSFQKLCKLKPVLFRENLRLKINDCKNNVNEFWKLVKSVNKVKTDNSCSASPNEWYHYFEKLLNENHMKEEISQQFIDLVNIHNQYCEQCDAGLPVCLNFPFTLNEVTSFINKLKNNKAPGIDGICNELLKYSVDIIGPEIVKIFNLIFETGKFPSLWCTAILFPLHKNGCVNNLNNYRGIALLCSLGKVFTGILNQRLNIWALENNILHEQQAGFRHARSTVDHIFTAYGAAEKYLCKKGRRFYFAYIDLSKAFDCVPHAALFNSLINSGIHGNILKILQSMYSQLTSCVQSNTGLTDMFKCTTGTRQGCMLSPFLFIVYLNQYITNCDDNCKGIYVDENFPNLNILLYADDMVHLSDTIGQTQNQLNILSQFCSNFGMKVNLNKSKIMVFRNGGPLKDNEKWFYNGEKVETVTYYKYLGVVFSNRLKWSKATKTLAAQANKALFAIKRLYKKCNGLSINVCFKLFDSMILPILCYGSEIWGYKKYDVIENVQLKFCKFLLGVNSNTTSSAVLGECGRNPLFVKYACRCIKYWCKVITMDDYRLPKATYIMLKQLDENGKITWVTHIKKFTF
jgi:hypothetical protein